MELNHLLNIFCNSDRTSREDQLRCIPKHHKTIFCTTLVSDLVSKSYPLDTSIPLNYIDHCHFNVSKRIDFNSKLEAIKIVTGWIKNRNVSFDAVINSVEANLAYQILTFSDSTDTEFQVAGEFLKMTVLLLDMKAPHAELFVHKILELEILYIYNISIERAKVLTQIFVALADKIFQWTLNEHPTEIDRRSEGKDKILTILIKCASSKACCELELPFWKKLPTYLKSSKVYAQFIEELILYFALHCRLIDSDEMDTNGNGLMVFRESVSEIMLALTSNIYTQNIIDFFFSLMPLCSDNDFEVCLFIITTVAKKAEKNEDKTIPNLIERILQISIDAHPSILSMAAKLLGEFDRWIDFFHRQYLHRVLAFLEEIMHKKTTAGSVAATAFGRIFSTCDTKMEPHLDKMVLIFQNLNVYFVHSKGKLAIAKGITHIGCSLMEPKRSEFLKLLSDIQLQRILEAQLAGNYVIHQIDCLAEIYHQMNVLTSHNEVNPLDIILNYQWPHICNLLDAYQANVEVMTKISEAIECAIPNISLSPLPLLDQMAKQFMFYFGISKCPKLLRPLNTIVDKLGNEEKCKDGLLTVFEGVTVLVMDALHDEMSHKLVEEYFYLAAAYFKKLSMIMLKSPVIIQVIELSIELCRISDKSSNGYVLDFMISIFTCNQSHPDIKLCVEQAMTLFGGRIVATLMESVIHVFDLTLTAKVVNIFDVFKTKSNAGFKELLVPALTMIPNRSATGILKVQESDWTKFVDLMTREKLSKCEMICGINDFRKLMRG